MAILLEVSLRAEFGVASSYSDETLHDEDKKAEENDEYKKHQAAHDGNLYVTQTVEEVFYF